MRHAKLLAACSAVVVTVAGMAQAGSISVPNYDFSVGSYNWSNQLMPNSPSGTFTTPIVATLAGWQVTFNPMTFNGGTYYNWTPYANVWRADAGYDGRYGTGAHGQPAFLGVFGGEVNTGMYWDGGPTNPVNHDRFLLTGESAVLTSTGITATTVAGSTYTATMAVGGAHWMDLSWPDAIKPSYTINLLVDGNVVSQSTKLSNPAFDVWTDISTSYVAPTSGQSIQIQVVATDIYAENWAPWTTGTPTFSDARLTESVPEPAAMAVLGVSSLGLLARRRKHSPKA